MTATCKLRSGASFTVVADAASVGSDAGSIRHEGTLIDAPVPSRNIVQFVLNQATF